MRVAALDLGTNTFLCLIAEVSNGKIEKVISDQVQVVRLGQGVNESKKFHPDALARADATLAEFSKVIQKYKPERILAMATSAARDVTNADELFVIAKKHNIPLQIIPGDKEASITYLGAISSEKDSSKTRLIVDVGGGSTEFILGKGEEIIAGQSLNLGCVRLTEKFQLLTPCGVQKIEEVRTFVSTQLETLFKMSSIHIDEILAVAGTPTELIRIELGNFDAEKINGSILSKEKLDHWINTFSQHSKQEIIDKFSVHPGRADVILVGAIILFETLKRFKKQNMTVSTRGVRFGIALEVAK